MVAPSPVGDLTSVYIVSPSGASLVVLSLLRSFPNPVRSIALTLKKDGVFC